MLNRRGQRGLLRGNEDVRFLDVLRLDDTVFVGATLANLVQDVGCHSQNECGNRSYKNDRRENGYELHGFGALV